MSLESPLSESASIVVVGLRNAGKSSLVNSIFAKEVAIVSAVPGTTTDPVTRKMELPNWGPVAFVDTAGIDDEGELGAKRIERTESRLSSAAAVVFVTAAHRPVEESERRLLSRLDAEGKPTIIALTHADLVAGGEGGAGDEASADDPADAPRTPHVADSAKAAWLAGRKVVAVDNRSGEGAAELRLAVSALAEGARLECGPLEGLAREGDHFLLVAPIDLAAPKGRLIQPQVETIRDALDRDCRVTVVKERELYEAYRSFRERPRLVITDSQAFSKAAADIDEDQPLTSFSILFARKKGELVAFLRGLGALASFSPGGRVFVMEACAHHRGADDIASVKIPRLFGRLVTPSARFQTVRQLPADLSKEDLVIHCAGCMMSGAALRARVARMEELGVNATNYGLFLAWANGLLPRAIEPFPEYADAYAPLFGGK